MEDGNLDDVVEEVRKAPRKSRKRRRRDDDDDDDDDDIIEKKPKKKGGRRGRPPVEKMTPIPAKVQHMMRKLVDIVINYVDADGRVLSEPFHSLPKRRELADYYEVIKKPVDFKKIKVNQDDPDESFC